MIIYPDIREMESEPMACSIQALYRYPVKGLSPEPIERVSLSAGFGFPGDRVFAIALPTNTYDSIQPTPKRKSEFLILARYPRLAAIRAAFDQSERTLSLEFDGIKIIASVDSQPGRLEIADFLQPFFEKADAEKEGLRLVEGSDEHRFTDVGPHSRAMMHAISIINLNSIRELEKIIGAKLDVRRFRSNIVIDGLPAWAEQDMFGRDFRIGTVEFRGVWPTSRCAATQVEPVRGERDIDLPKILKMSFGHNNLGVYISSLSSGTIRVGDTIDFSAGLDFTPHAKYLISDERPEENGSPEKRIYSQLTQEFGLQDDHARVIAEKPLAFEFFTAGSALVNDRKIFAKWMVNELFGRLNRDATSLDNSPVSATDFGILCKGSEDGRISASDFKVLLDVLWKSGGDITKMIQKIEQRRVVDSGSIRTMCEQLVAANPDSVLKYRTGNRSVLGWFVGQIMKTTSGGADPRVIQAEMLKALEADT